MNPKTARRFGSLAATVSLLAACGSVPDTDRSDAGRSQADIVQRDPQNAEGVALSSPLGPTSEAAASPSAEDREQRQAVLDGAADRLMDAMSSASAGYAGLVVSPDEGFLTIYWAGERPPRLLRALDGERRRGVDVRIGSANHTFDELLAAQSKVVADEQRSTAGIVMTAPATDGSGLIIGHVGSGEEVLMLPSVRALTVPVKLVEQDPIEPASRWQDLSPFSGGAAITSVLSGHYCSTAFAVRRPDGDRFMLTAAHCPKIGQYRSENWITAGGGVPYGFTNINRWSEANDTAWIDEPNFLTQYGPYVYMGGTDITGVGSGERKSKVVGTTTNYNGDYVCTSGAFSGERCSIRIENNAANWWFTGPDNRTWLMVGVQALHTGGGNAAGQGDSGGPVVKKSGTAYVYAQGVISAISSQVRCTGIETFFGKTRYCGKTVYYGDINRIMSDLNFKVVTTSP